MFHVLFNTRAGPKGLQYMLDKMGGRQVRWYSFDKARMVTVKTDEELDADHLFQCLCFINRFLMINQYEYSPLAASLFRLLS